MASDYVNAHQVCGAADPQGNARRHDDQIILLQKPGIHARIYGTFEKLIRIGDFLDQQRSDPPAQAQLAFRSCAEVQLACEMALVMFALGRGALSLKRCT